MSQSDKKFAQRKAALQRIKADIMSATNPSVLYRCGRLLAKELKAVHQLQFSCPTGIGRSLLSENSRIYNMARKRLAQLESRLDLGK
jgi:hypothetical protein